jgi:hypothetical protein
MCSTTQGGQGKYKVCLSSVTVVDILPANFTCVHEPSRVTNLFMVKFCNILENYSTVSILQTSEITFPIIKFGNFVIQGGQGK